MQSDFGKFILWRNAISPNKSWIQLVWLNSARGAHQPINIKKHKFYVFLWFMFFYVMLCRFGILIAPFRVCLLAAFRKSKNWTFWVCLAGALSKNRDTSLLAAPQKVQKTNPPPSFHVNTLFEKNPPLSSSTSTHCSKNMTIPWRKAARYYYK